MLTKATGPWAGTIKVGVFSTWGRPVCTNVEKTPTFIVPRPYAKAIHVRHTAKSIFQTLTMEQSNLIMEQLYTPWTPIWWSLYWIIQTINQILVQHIDSNNPYIYNLWSLIYSYLTYPDYSLIPTHVWEPIPIPQHKVTHLSGNSVIRIVSLGTVLSG